jgi:alkylhydroperoxidase/carboxymuconolactone decarboxylase family protein YurZ
MASTPKTSAAILATRNEVRGVIPRVIELSETLLYSHTQRALANGVTKEEISELITHLAFYAGWPSAMSAAKIAKQVFEEKPA